MQFCSNYLRMKADDNMNTELQEENVDVTDVGSDEESLLRTHASILPTIIQLFLKSQQLEQQHQINQQAVPASAQATSNNMPNPSLSLLASPALSCSSLLSGMALFLQLVDSIPIARAVEKDNTKVKGNKTVPVAVLHPLHSFLPLFYSLCSPFLLPLLRYDSASPPQQRIPIPTTASPQQSLTAKQLTIRFMTHLTQHEHVCAAIAQSPDSVSFVQLLMARLNEVTTSTSTSSSNQSSDVEDAIILLDRVTSILSTTSSDKSSIISLPSLSLPLLQPLVDTISNNTAALPQQVQMAAARVFAVLIPHVSVSTQPLLFSRFIPSLSTSVDRDHGALKFGVLQAILACFSKNDQLCEQGKGLEDSHEKGTIARRKHAADFPLYALQIRQALQTVMGSKLDTEKRFVAIKLSRVMLERYGPLWASVPMEITNGSTSSLKDPSSAKSSSASSPSSPLPHLTFLQVWSNVFSVELRLGLYELTASSEIRSDRGMTQEKQQQFVMEALQCFRMLLQFLLGGDDEEVENEEDEDEQGKHPKSQASQIKNLVASFQWWNLPMSLLMHFKKQLDECINSLLEYLSDLQSILQTSGSLSTGVNSLSDQDLRILYTASLALVEWMSEESEAIQLHQEAICAILPFLIQLPRLPERVSLPLPSNGTILGVLLTPMQGQLVHDAKAAAVLLRERVPMQLIERVLVPLYNDDIKKQMEFLSQLSSASNSRVSSGASARRAPNNNHDHDDTSDLHGVILSHLRRHILTISTGCDVIHVLCDRKGVDARETKHEIRLRRTQLQLMLEACLDIAQQKLLSPGNSTAMRPTHAEEQDETLEDALASIQQLLDDLV